MDQDFQADSGVISTFACRRLPSEVRRINRQAEVPPLETGTLYQEWRYQDIITTSLWGRRDISPICPRQGVSHSDHAICSLRMGMINRHRVINHEKQVS
jgi:hypothetical protein